MSAGTLFTSLIDVAGGVDLQNFDMRREEGNSLGMILAFHELNFN
jgi:hypothetical protein